MLFFWQICRSFIVMCIPFFTVFYSSNLEWWKLKLNTWSKMSLESIQYTQNSIRKKEWQERETTRTSPQFRSIYLVFLISGLVANSLYVSVTVTMLAILVFTFNPRTEKKKYMGLSDSILFFDFFFLFFYYPIWWKYQKILNEFVLKIFLFMIYLFMLYKIWSTSCNNPWDSFSHISNFALVLASLFEKLYCPRCMTFQQQYYSKYLSLFFVWLTFCSRGLIGVWNITELF